MRSVALPVPAASPHPSGSCWQADPQESREWSRAVSRGLAERYGRWAAGWSWGIGSGDYGGESSMLWGTDMYSITTPGETIARVANCLIRWRNWLEDVAWHFDQLLPMPGPEAAPAVAFAAWEAAGVRLAHAAGSSTDIDNWGGWVWRVYFWFAEAAEAAGCAGEGPHDVTQPAAFVKHFWFGSATLDIAEAAQWYARRMTGHQDARDWPDIWPHDWPSRRQR
ncbi:hypothetical protein [Longispora albida]|uniref:hypothetical protein n=1 Tax=Longispora albida TaxID=203523 RepID=UPI000364E9D7|nr:hypothetical protein [Longispora albida]